MGKEVEVPRRAYWSKTTILTEFDPTVSTVGWFKFKRPKGESYRLHQEGLIMISPPESESAAFDPYLAAYNEMFGESWRDEFVGKVGAGELVEAGWGHGFETQAAVNAMTKLFGTPVYMYSANIVTGQKSRGFEVKRKAHSALQNGQDIFAHLREERLIPEKFKDDPKGYIRYLLTRLAVHSVDVNDGDRETGFEKFLNKHPKEARALLWIIGYAEYQFFDADMVRELEKIREQLGIGFVFSSHPATLRGFRNDQANKQPAVTLPVDPGYIFKNLNIDISLILEEITHGAPELAPSDIVSRVMQEYYGIDAYSAGTIADVISKQEAVDKWKDTKQSRLIMASTSGNGSNMDELAVGIRHFREYAKKHADSPYSLLVFTGEHKNEKIVQVTQAIKEDQGNTYQIDVTWNRPFAEIAAEIKANNGKVILIRTNDVALTVMLKLELEKLVLVEAVKSGEAPLMVPQVGTLDLITTPTGTNEQFNALYGVLNGGSVMANFMPGHQNLWEPIRSGVFDLMNRLQLAGLIDWGDITAWHGQQDNPESGWNVFNRKLYSNMFDQIDDLFGDTDKGRETGINFTRRTVFKGLVNLRNATFTAIAVIIAQKLNVPLDNDLYTKLDNFYEAERVRALTAIKEAGFTDDHQALKDSRPVFH